MTATESASKTASADERAHAVEEQMADDERFAMIISLGATRVTGGVRDKRYPEDAPLTAGYTPGVPRLGVPALLSSDASMGSPTRAFGPTTRARPPGRRRCWSARRSTLDWRVRAPRRSLARRAAEASTSSSLAGSTLPAICTDGVRARVRPG